MGRLDRTIILGGGTHLQEECNKHSPCKEGEVVLTGGYDLPAKHVLHAITPATYRVDALEVLRVSEPPVAPGIHLPCLDPH
jgi:O-acetyl-ADP-ribose deacetylase (regulator of RNase III)